MPKKIVYGLLISSVLFFVSAIFSKQCSAAGEEPSISLISPLGGETYTAGQIVNIRWNQTNVDMVNIGYKTCQSCLDWIMFTKQVNIGDPIASHDWVIPANFQTGSNYQIEIVAYHVGVGSKLVNSGTFTINAVPPPANINQTQSVVNPTTVSQNQTVVSSASQEAYKAVVKVKTYKLDDDNMLEQASEGSGIIISASGLVLTNDHVVSVRSDYDDSEYAVAFQICLTKSISDKPDCTYSANLIAKDADKDTALLKIVNFSGISEMIELPFLNLNQTDSTNVNDEVTAIGYPAIGGETVTVTKGIISGKTDKYDNKWLKTDAVISYGSSGGAALNASGEVVGITTQIYFDLSGELGYLLNTVSFVDWIAANKDAAPKFSPLFYRLKDLTKKQKILTRSNKVINLYPYFYLIKPSDWKFDQPSESSVTISKPHDKDSGNISVNLIKAPYFTDLKSVKPMLLRQFNKAGMSTVVKINKEKDAKINNFKGKFLTLSISGKMFNSYVFPLKEYLVWIEYNYGNKDKDKKTIDNIVNSFRSSKDGPKFNEVHKFSQKNPRLSLSTSADWPILVQANKLRPLSIQNKKIREAFVEVSLEKADESNNGLTNTEYVAAMKDQLNSMNQATGIIDYKFVISKTSAKYKLNKEITDAMYIDGTERTAGTNKIVAFDRDYFIKRNGNFININLTVYTDSKAVFNNALTQFNKMLQTLSFK
jgi:S1-C subfamily serine protease